MLKKLTGVGVVVAICVALAGLGSASASANRALADAHATKKGGCGTIPTRAYADKSGGLLKSLGSSVMANFDGLNIPVLRSHWIHWKPSKTRGYKVGLVFGPLENGAQTVTYNGIVDTLKRSPLVSKVIARTTTSYSATEELQDYQSLVEQHVNAIIIEPLASVGFNSAVAAAAKAGIPTVAIDGAVNSSYSINFEPNGYLLGAVGAADLFKLMGGKGDVLHVIGLPGEAVSVEVGLALSDAAKLCPNIDVVGQVTGDYSDSTAQSATLQFLSSHPGTVGGAIEDGSMASGIAAAFTQLGRQLPPLAALQPSAGFLASWAAKTSSGYKAISPTVSPIATGVGAADIALMTLQGDGPKLDTIPMPTLVVDNGNLKQWATTTNVASQGPANGPASETAALVDYAQKFFEK